MKRFVSAAEVLASIVPPSGQIVGPPHEAARAEQYRVAFNEWHAGLLPWDAVVAAWRGRLHVWYWTHG